MRKKYVKQHSTGGNHAVEYHNGTRVEWLRFPSAKAAESACRAIQWMIDHDGPITVAQFLDLWVELHVLVRVRAATPAYLRSVEEAVEHFGDEHLLADVSVGDIEAFIDSKRSGGLTNRRITPILNVWSSAFSTAKKWRFIKTNPVSQIDGLFLGTSKGQ